MNHHSLWPLALSTGLLWLALLAQAGAQTRPTPAPAAAATATPSALTNGLPGQPNDNVQ